MFTSSRLLIVAAVALCSSATHGDILYVDVDNCPGPGDGTELNPFCSIQDAIDDAVDTDEIVVAPGTYRETINFFGKAITLHSSDGPGVTTIDALGTGSAVICGNLAGSDTVLEGFTITGGIGNDPGNGYYFGGGMLILSSSPTVNNCKFTDNSASYGGAVYTEVGSPVFTGCTFARNWATENGGGIYNNGGAAQVHNSVYCDNAPNDIAGSPVSGSGNDFLAQCPQSCSGDVDGSGTVNVIDFLALLANWGPCP
ncbi:MAG: right-handed parallel beta-helix repeat-containing protein [Planctomycetota bacterium]|jgi:predicted outer membrane repeat protein